ncbi:hypothetical protein WME79_22755 [Sorangium sp. So ce726]|uniref:hypothetical protein n=1 Tax=Sorangium sp. So ce726 TaxID=3133319 RepID=UPI003F62CF91
MSGTRWVFFQNGGSRGRRAALLAAACLTACSSVVIPDQRSGGTGGDGGATSTGGAETATGSGGAETATGSGGAETATGSGGAETATGSGGTVTPDDLPWSKTIAGSGAESPRAVAADPQGNVFLSAEIYESIDLGCGPLSAAPEPLNAPDLGAFVAKLDASGACLWNVALPNTASGIAKYSTLAADAQGNLLAAGLARGTFDLGAGPMAGATESQDILIAKYAPDGRLLWAKRFGNDAVQLAPQIAVDRAGNAVVTGGARGSIPIGDEPIVGAGGVDALVMKLDATGEVLWGKLFGDHDYQACRGVALDRQGNVLVMGDFGGTIDFGGGPLVSAGDRDIFVAKLDPDGTPRWSKRFGGALNQTGLDIDTDGHGALHVLAALDGTVDFGGGALTASSGIAVAKLDPDGQHIWSRQFGDGMSLVHYQIAADDQGNTVLTGSFGGTIDFGNGPIGSGDGAVEEAFVAKLDPHGDALWSRCFCGAGAQFGWDIDTDPGGNAFVLGGFAGTVDFGSGPISAQMRDVFLLKLSP